MVLCSKEVGKLIMNAGDIHTNILPSEKPLEAVEYHSVMYLQ